MQDRYIGPFKVIAASDTEHKTPKGSPIVEVMFEGKPSQKMTKKTFEMFVSETPVDLTLYRDRLFEKMVPEIVSVIAEYDVKMGDVSTLMQMVSDTLFDNYDRASTFLWTGDDSQFVPKFNNAHNRTLIETDIVLKTIPKNEQAKTESK